MRISTAPNFITIPPTPVIRITDATKRFLFLFKSTVWNILRPETAINPHNATQTPPITQFGIVVRKATSGVKRLKMIQRIAHPQIETVEALRVIATHPIDSNIPQ